MAGSRQSRHIFCPGDTCYHSIEPSNHEGENGPGADIDVRDPIRSLLILPRSLVFLHRLTPQLVRALISLKLERELNAVGPDKLVMRNVLSRDEFAFKILQMETISTKTHPNPEFREQVGAWIKAGGRMALVLALQRKRRLLETNEFIGMDREKLQADIEDIEQILKMYEDGGEFEKAEKYAHLNWIVARKAVTVEEGEPWMEKVYPYY